MMDDVKLEVCEVWVGTGPVAASDDVVDVSDEVLDEEGSTPSIVNSGDRLPDEPWNERM